MKNTKDYALKFTYSTELVFDYFNDNWITFTECVKIYGEDAAKHAISNPGRTVKSDSLSQFDQPVIRFTEQMIKS